MHNAKDTGYSRTKALTASAMLMATSAAVDASESSASDWQYGLVIYGWLPSISGDLKFSPLTPAAISALTRTRSSTPFR